jgi:diguanylate cyclase (GGDEF)-like protein
LPFTNIHLKSAEEPRPTVLIVDDSIDVHRLLKANLKSEDLDFLSAADGESGLALAQQHVPSLIILDLDMPTIDGLAVLRRLKDEARTQHIPIIVLSGQQDPSEKVLAFDLGAIDFVTKPFEVTELRVRVRSALRTQQLLHMLAQRAQIDGLTGLWNRTFFDRRWSEEHARWVRHGHPVSIALLDLDHFKAVNDTYGHPVGDMALQSISKILQRESRHSDLACRYGGEEFVLLMPDANVGDAVLVCERIREAVEQARWARLPNLQVTVSIGVAGCTGPCPVGPDQWVEEADRNLYSAKRAGRNRVVSTDLAASTLRGRSSPAA